MANRKRESFVSTIYQAKSIRTMDPHQPHATHLAVKDGHILAVGTGADVADWQSAWGPLELNTDFAERTLLPGFIEGHAHMMEGLLWDYHYVGYYDREGPDGTIWPGLKSIDDVVAHLKQIQETRDDPSEPLIAWGFDPIYFEGRRMTANDLDSISAACPVAVLHASLHILNANNFIMDAADVKNADNSEFIRRDTRGKPTGEFLGQLGMYMAMRTTNLDLLAAASSPKTLQTFSQVARQTGVTTCTDLANPVPEGAEVAMRETVEKDSFPMRLVVAYQGNSRPPEESVARMQALQDKQSDKLRFSLVKFVADGSIQGFSARLKWPHYYNGAPNGLWYIEPDRLREYLKAFTAAGFQCHVHTNGDECTEVTLDAIEDALRAHPWPDHRHTLQHCQMASRAHFKRMKNLGVGVNLFSNHLYYWGDEHRAITMGPERAGRLDDAGGCLEEGVPLAIHSDAPVTALAPLFTAWCAVNRLSSSGVTLGGESEKISLEQALYAITMGAAYSLRLDTEIGSLEVGKRADIAILADDPIEVGAAGLKDISVIGTMVDGHVHLNKGRDA
ncbi:MAG: amidohydrolase [Rhodobiaceae bacterium]|jgi:predicted amidohydrolase YtcJ|nr:amidohydrolase [Rhodobiaceae bacterium]MBT7279600.1 amidohydrolase [Rhodobiaceae bacterium]